MNREEAPRSTTRLSLKLGEIDTDTLEAIVNEAEKTIRKVIRRHVKDTRIFDYNLIITMEKKRDSIELDLDLAIIGDFPGRLSYDEIVERALDEAEKKIENLLKKYARRSTHD